LGTSTKPARQFAPDEEALGFDNQAAAQSVSPLLVEQYMVAAEALAIEAAPKYLGDMAPCEVDIRGEACSTSVAAWIEDFGVRAYRRPLAPDEIDRLVLLFQDAALVESDPVGAAELVITAMLQSPSFLYRLEEGERAPSGMRRATSYELASRLSFLIWGGMPDFALMESAATGAIHQPDELLYQAERMLDAPLARRAVLRFFDQWLRLEEVETRIASQGKDEEMFPDYRDAILPMLRHETEAFIETTLFEDQSGVDTLFTASWSMLNADLAEWYGLEGDDLPTGDDFERVELDPEYHAGFLTHSGLLALYAKPDRSSPVHRGVWVRESILCQIPPPPPDVVPEPPEVDENQTTRDRFAQHSEDPYCSGCHQLLDPIGLGFEHFDATGRYRATQRGLELDVTGEIVQGGDATGTFVGAVELAQLLAESDTVQQCFSTQWFRFGLGRVETDDDKCSMDGIHQRFQSSGYNMRELLLAQIQSDTFLAAPPLSTPEATP
jgi:hypothetical protein